MPFGRRGCSTIKDSEEAETNTNAVALGGKCWLPTLRDGNGKMQKRQEKKKWPEQDKTPESG